MDNEVLLFKLKIEKEKALKAHADLAYSLGIYFGYPKCCITQFCSEIINERDPSERNIDGSGFIPCREHYLEIISGDIKLIDLIKNRVCNDKF